MELQKQVEKVVTEIEGFKRKVEDIEEKNQAYVQKITKLQSYLQCQRTAVEQERESWRKERERLQKRVAKLEAALVFRKTKWQKERERAMLNMKNKKEECKKISVCIKDTLKLFEKEEKVAEEAQKRTVKIQDLLQKNLQQVADLTSALKKQELENQRFKEKMERRNTFNFHTIKKLQNTLKRHKEETKLKEHEKHNLVKNQEQLERRVAQLEAILVSAQKQHKHTD